MTQNLKDLPAEFILENTSSACVIHDNKGEIIYVNPAAETFFGISSNELLTNKKNLSDWTLHDSHGKQLDKEDFPVSYVLKTSNSYPPRLIGYKPPNLPIRWCFVKAYPKYDAAGSLELVFVSFTDETKNKNLLKELREEKEILQHSEMLLCAGSWTFDIDTQKVHWSQNIYTIFEMNSK